MMPLALVIFSFTFICLGIVLYQYEQRKLPVYRFVHLSETADAPEAEASESLKKFSGDSLSEKYKSLISLVIVVLCVTICWGAGVAPVKLIGVGVASFGVSVIALGQVQKMLKETQQRRIVQSVPLVMERLVMAVESGLDIVPAIKSIIHIDNLAQTYQRRRMQDLVIDALRSVIDIAERGTAFEEALKLVAKKYDNHALTHAFVHLGIAFKEGGEVIGPLRELSDATQNYYQETVEEDLAKLPIKATAPLIVTFAGLILFFLSSPLVQILSFAARAVPGK